MKGRLFLGLCVLSIMGFLFFTSHPIKRSEESAIGVAYPRTAKNRIEQMFQSGEIQSRSVNLFLQYIRYGDPGKRNGNSQLFNELKGKVKEALGGRRGRIRRNDLLEKLGEDPRNYPGRNIMLYRNKGYLRSQDVTEGFFPEDHNEVTTDEEDLISSDMLGTLYQNKKTDKERRDYHLRKQAILESLVIGKDHDEDSFLPLDMLYEIQDIIYGKKKVVRPGIGKLDDVSGIIMTIVPKDSLRAEHIKSHYVEDTVYFPTWISEQMTKYIQKNVTEILNQDVNIRSDLILTEDKKKEYIKKLLATEIAYRRYLKVLTYDIKTGSPLSLPLPVGRGYGICDDDGDTDVLPIEISNIPTRLVDISSQLADDNSTPSQTGGKCGDGVWCWGSEGFEHTIPKPKQGGYHLFWQYRNWRLDYER